MTAINQEAVPGTKYLTVDGPGRLARSYGNQAGPCRAKWMDGGSGWVRNLVSGPVNRYQVLFEAIENIRTLVSPEDHLIAAVTGTKTNTPVRGSYHQPCLSELLIPGLPHRRH